VQNADCSIGGWGENGFTRSLSLWFRRIPRGLMMQGFGFGSLPDRFSAEGWGVSLGDRCSELSSASSVNSYCFGSFILRRGRDSDFRLTRYPKFQPIG
jgi:hypothetical protein